MNAFLQKNGFNLDDYLYSEGERIISPEEVSRALSELSVRLCADREGFAEIAFEGKWLGLCRTDLKDDVGTGPGHGYCRETGRWNANEWDAEQFRAHYLQKNQRAQWGARVTTDSFKIIDSFSDG